MVSSVCLMVEYALAGAAVPIVCRSLTFVELYVVVVITALVM